MAKTITSGLFSQTIFHVLQYDSTQYKPQSHKKRRRHSIAKYTPHYQHELDL